jgi:transposase-like protein
MAESIKVQQWTKRITEFERSGLSRQAWCKQEGVKPNTLDYWRKRLRDRAPALVPMVVTGAAAGSVAIEITLPNGTRVRATNEADAEWLSALIRGVAGC